MIVGVFGPRDFKAAAEARKGHYYNNYSYIAECLDEYEASKIISGGGFGVEQLALRYAVENKIDHQVEPPLLDLHGADAFPARNKTIIGLCDVIVIFWDGKDRFYHSIFAEAIEQKTLAHLRHVE